MKIGKPLKRQRYYGEDYCNRERDKKDACPDAPIDFIRQFVSIFVGLHY